MHYQKPMMLRCVVAMLIGLFVSQSLPSVEGGIELRVMSFNIEWGGRHISFEKVVEAIRLADADIVGIQEAEANLEHLASALNMHRDQRNYVLSRFPLIDPPSANGRYVFVEVEPGKIVAVSNQHLPSSPYGPDAVRDGKPPEQILAIEHRRRLPKIKPVLEVLSSLISQEIPVFLTGDFNAPSHLDWTDRTAGSRPFLRYPVNWPVSLAVSKAGFRDSWREVYPDPLTHPGLTWWAERPPLESYSPDESDPKDRIDFVWFAGPVSVKTSELIGEQGVPEVSISVHPWPSDHRAVVSGFTASPAEMPELISTGRRIYGTGESVEVIYNSRQETVMMLQRLDQQGRPVEIIRHRVSGNGRLALPAELFDPGHYRVLIPKSAGRQLQSREFWVQAAGEAAEVEVLDGSYIQSEAIGIQWRKAPGNRNDYVAVFDSLALPGSQEILAWAYLNAMPEGLVMLGAATAEANWPVEPGSYVVRMLEDDGYRVLAESAHFVVNAKANPTLQIQDDLQTEQDGRPPIQDLFNAYTSLLDRGWKLDVVTTSQPPGTITDLPVIAIRSPHSGPAIWVISGIHGEEPAGPIAIANGIDNIAALAEHYSVVLLPLLNPHGYARNWRYLNVPEWSDSVEGKSVGDSSHLLLSWQKGPHHQSSASSPEADAISRYIVKMSKSYPPIYSIDLHEDKLIDQGYVYSQGLRGSGDELALEAIKILEDNGIPVKMSGQTRFEEEISGGIIGPVSDGSIDELMSSRMIMLDGHKRAGPAARTVLVFETPAGGMNLERRVAAHLALLRSLAIRK